MKQNKGQQSFAKRMHWSEQTPSYNNTREDSTHGHHQMVNTEIRLITAVPLAKSLSRHIIIIFVKTFKIWRHSNFEVYYIVLLTVITTLCITPLELLHLLSANWYTLVASPWFPYPWHLLTTILLSVSTSLAFLDSTYITIFVFVRLILLSIMPSHSLHAVANGKISLCFMAE